MSGFRVPAAYEPRSTRFLRLWHHDGWRLKVYGLAYERPAPEPGLVEAALHRATECLPMPAVAPDRYGLGFIGVHQGRGSNLAFVSWWENQNELFHRVFTSDPATSLGLEPVGSTGLTACVWDLALIAFEREAWVGTMMAGPELRGPEGYLAARLAGTI